MQATSHYSYKVNKYVSEDVTQHLEPRIAPTGNYKDDHFRRERALPFLTNVPVIVVVL
jgi:hypothetical protein